MVYIITPRYQRRRFFRPRRRGKCWRAIRRYQLIELLVLTGGIALVWLGAHLDNQSTQMTKAPPLGIESASADLITGVPVPSEHPKL
jgi:hypothetical protein